MTSFAAARACIDGAQMKLAKTSDNKTQFGFMSEY